MFMNATLQPSAVSAIRAPDERCSDRAASGADADESEAERTARHLRTLKELAEIGMDLARTVRRQAMTQADAEIAAAEHGAAAPAVAAADLALVFARISRAVRQTLALEAKLAEEGHERDAKRAAERKAEAARQKRRARTLREVKERVEEAIEDEAEDATHAERLRLELTERLEDVDDTEFGDNSVGDIIDDIRRDLGLGPEWLRGYNLGDGPEDDRDATSALRRAQDEGGEDGAADEAEPTTAGAASGLPAGADKARARAPP